jgi:hypothetical protein
MEPTISFCACGSIFLTHCIYAHLKTKKHKKWYYSHIRKDKFDLTSLQSAIKEYNDVAIKNNICAIIEDCKQMNEHNDVYSKKSLSADIRPFLGSLK